MIHFAIGFTRHYILLRELLCDEGTIYIRFDQYWSHYVKLIADEVFGKNNFQNDIAVKRIYKNLTNQGKKSLQIATDSLLLYFKSEKGKFFEIEEKLGEEREGYWRRIDDSSGIRNPPERKILGTTYYPPPGKHFKFGQRKIDEMLKVQKIQINEKGRPEYWVEASDKKPLTSNWTDISGYSFTTGYPTENSEALLERVIRISSEQGQLVLDCFGGLAQPQLLLRNLGGNGLPVIRAFCYPHHPKRLLDITNVKPFVIQNLGKYERQLWQVAEFGENAEAKMQAYRQFHLGLVSCSTDFGLHLVTWDKGRENGTCGGCGLCHQSR